ncbi:hypothetical protein BpHYR1_005843 [Brachionus plicatilis]|uniref:Uncharacterized protein n=1 Tax=Brachionus plicatilis TaxID=10195 RepID=A0A3M7SDG7_BRAPC|nr:hypothetical protein BpHYR1_005843 [Brachionus plicatilis]
MGEMYFGAWSKSWLLNLWCSKIERQNTKTSKLICLQENYRLIFTHLVLSDSVRKYLRELRSQN